MFNRHNKRRQISKTNHSFKLIPLPSKKFGSQDKVHKALLKCLVLTEHSQQNCEQALQSTAEKYSSAYQNVMQQHLAEYHQHMDLLKKMTSKSML